MLLRLTTLILSLALGGCAVVAAPAESSAALVDIGAGISGPAGLRASVVATGLPNVAALVVDEQGRLWAATAAFDDAGTDAISIVTASGSAPTTVVTGLHTVLGLLWLGDELVVTSKEQVTAYGEFDGAHFATSRILVSFPAGVGEVNGIALGPDGRLVVGISAPCNACTPTMADSGTVVSFLPDGSDLRILATGIRAPVGLAFVPGTSRLIVSMNQRDDLGDATPGDILGSVSAGQDWGFPDCTGPSAGACIDVPAALATLDPHAAASGVAIVTGQLGSTVGTSAVVAEWAKGVVLRAPIDRTTVVAGQPFLAGFSNPVPVALDPAGGILVGDWGSGMVYRITSG